MTDVQSSHRLFRRYLKEQGLPVTQQREAVASVVIGSNRRFSVEEIEDSLRATGRRIGKATIYRTLDLLVRSRLVVEHDFGEGFKRYEDRMSGGSVSHHLICLECGEVTEFEAWEIHQVQATVTAVHGFKPTRHKLEIHGLCRACQDRGAELPSDGLTCPIEIV
jgi:Fur family ferric uptake transcriptional regulator